jgi:RNA polymerase sigma factor (sigma-70 family)
VGVSLLAPSARQSLHRLSTPPGQRTPSRFDESQFADGATTPLQELERQELQDQLLRCIDELKPKQKAAMVLRDIEGYSVEETAALLSCTKNNVLCNLHLARENVRRKMLQWVETK